MTEQVSETRKSRHKKESQAEQPQVQITVQPPQAPQAIPQVPPAMQNSMLVPPTLQQQQTPITPRVLTPDEQEFINALSNLITSAQELSYALAAVSVDEDELSEEVREILSSAREVVRAIRQFQRIVKKRTGGALP